MKIIRLYNYQVIYKNIIGRDINSNAVSINQEKIRDDKLNLTSGEYILQKGKKSFAKIIIKQKRLIVKIGKYEIKLPIIQGGMVS